MKTYLDYFKELCRIPHGSGNTKAISDYCVSFAREQGLKYRQDAANNVVIFKEATAGREQEPGVLLQGHLDMVAVKEPELCFDFFQDPLHLEEDGDVLFARGTSLGGDDGIAVAYMLAVLASDSISHPRLECVFTTDEEIGMLGAAAMDMSDLTSRYMINIDSEIEGVLTVSCAGGAGVEFFVPARRETVEGELLRLELSGLTGGHSGTEIHRNRSNAILLMTELLRELEKVQPVRLRVLHGGSADNVIPSSCAAEVIVSDGVVVRELLEEAALEKQVELASTEPGFTFHVIPAGTASAETADAESAGKLLALCAELPNGVQAMSQELEGMVETSSNLGTMELRGDGYHFVCAPRSAREEEKEALIRAFAGLAEKYGARMKISGNYPGWPVRKESKLVPLMIKVYRDLFDREPTVEAIHAGLECGIFSQNLPQLDIVSMGPNMYDIHSTKERLSLSSAERIWNYLLEILKQIH